MPAEQHISHFELKLNGSPINSDLMNDMLDCTIENSLHLPDVCTLRFHDERFKWVDDDNLSEGKSIEVKGGHEGADNQLIFKGEIVALEMDMVAGGVPTMLVRCYDKSHRLHRGRQSRTYENMKDSDIVSKVAGEAGLSSDIDETTVVHDWVIQNNQTNWEFLQERASYAGFRVFVSLDEKLHFKKLNPDGDGMLELEWGNELRSFRPRRSGATQVDKVEVRGWDYHQKRVIVGTKTQPQSQPNAGTQTASSLATTFGSSKHIVVDQPIHIESEANNLAQSVLDRIGSEFLQAEGLCFGTPQLRPGMVVKIKNIGRRFNGKYYVTSTQHTFSPSEGFTTLFGVDGKAPSDVVSVLTGGQEASGQGTRLGGNIVIGIVTDNKDPEKQGRVKVKYPWLTEEHQSFWARQSSQMAGSSRGHFNIPEVDDEVLVAFEHGDMRRPFILGQLWNGKDKMPVPDGPPMLGGGGEVNRRGYWSRIGHQLNFDDTNGMGNVEILTKKGHKVILDDKNSCIIVQDYAGNKMKIDSNSGAIDITCTGNLTIDAGGKATIKAKLGIELNTPMQVKIEGTTGVDVKGLNTTVEGTAMATVKASGVLTIQGSLVKIN